MLGPLIRRSRSELRSKERGFTMAMVAVAMATIICVAALSIDLGTLYEAKAEAQRAADAAALTAARVISVSGVTGTTQATWAQICGGASSPATLAAISMAQQNLIGGIAVASGSVNVGYGAGSAGGSNADCSTLGAAFAVNPIVTVSLQRTNLPVFFARIFSLFGRSYSGNSVSATATAEAFNPSGSVPLVPVHPRCVKPWFVPNQDPRNGAQIVSPTTGAIVTPGIAPAGPIGETFSLAVDCGPSGRRRGRCMPTDNPPKATTGATPLLDYVPGQVSGPSLAIAANSAISACSEATTNDYSEAVAGCDQTTVYSCGDSLANTVDLTEDPGPPRNDSVNGAQCLINATAPGPGNGQDVLAPDAAPYNYPFQITAGGNSALVSAGIASGKQITSSPSIVSLPIYDSAAVTTLTPPTTSVTVIGFLQVFINNVNANGNINVTVMNVAGCGNSSPGPPLALGTSPVPVRLITPP
ncbi:MAG: pilus assembly protein TadG-related protein [Candidatus Sulfotelmatobacter sp.]